MRQKVTHCTFNSGRTIVADSSVIHLDKEGESFIDGSSPENFRAHNLLSLIEPLVPHLPASIEFVMTAHDMGTYIPGEDQREFLAEKISAGEYVTQKELERYEWNHRHLEAGVAGLAVSDNTTSLTDGRASAQSLVPHGDRR